jgi:hypothetical protein
MTKYLLKLEDSEWHWSKAPGYCFTCHPEHVKEPLRHKRYHCNLRQVD